MWCVSGFRVSRENCDVSKSTSASQQRDQRICAGSARDGDRQVRRRVDARGGKQLPALDTLTLELRPRLLHSQSHESLRLKQRRILPQWPQLHDSYWFSSQLWSASSVVSHRSSIRWRRKWIQCERSATSSQTLTSAQSRLQVSNPPHSAS